MQRIWRMLKKRSYHYTFKKRTFLYTVIGSFCVLVDYFTFVQLSKFISPILANPLGYLIGSFCSYNLNKKYTFKSQNSKLSLIRFSLNIFFGLIASQLVIYFGFKVLNMKNSVNYIKLIAIFVSVSTQYFGNTFWGSVIKK